VAKRRWLPDRVQEMNDLIAAKWDSQVTDGDVVLLLGDIFVGDIQRGFDWFRQRPGIKYLVLGNWDNPHPVHGGPIEPWLEENGAPFAIVEQHVQSVIGSKGYNASHCPYATGPEQGYRLVDQAVPLLRGHTHSYKRLSFTRMVTP